MYSGTAIAVLVYLHCITLQQNTTQRQQWQCWSIHNTSHCSRTPHRDSNGSVGLFTIHHTAAEHHTETAMAVLVYSQYITLQQNTTQRQQWQCWSIHNTSHCSRTSCRNSNGSFSLSMIHSIAAEHHTEKQWQYWSIHTPYFSRTLHRDSNGSFGLSTVHCTAGEHHTETAVLVYPQYTVLQENITQGQQYWSIHNTLQQNITQRQQYWSIHNTLQQNITQRQQYWSIHNTLQQNITQRQQYWSIHNTQQQNITQRQEWQYHYQSTHNTLYLFTRPIATEHHTKRQQRHDQSIYIYINNIKLQKNIMQRWQRQESVDTHCITLQKNIAQKYNNSSTSVHNTYCSRSSSHKETATAVLLSVYPHYITLQKNITQKYNNSSTSVHNTYCSRSTSHKETATAVLLSVYPHYITLQKNITQKYNNSSTSVHNTYCSRSSSHKETATAVLLSVYPHYITLQKNITQRDSNSSIAISLSTLHHTAEEHHTKRQQQQYCYQSIHTTSHCRRTSHKETATAVLLSVYPHYITLQKNITQRDSNSSIAISLSTLHHTAEEHHTKRQQQQYCYQSIHTTSHCRRTSHKETATAVLLSVYPHYITLQKNITQRDSNSSITISLSTLHHTAEEHHTKRQQQQYYYQSIHTTSHCRRTSLKETATAVLLSVYPHYITLQKNITQRDSNSSIAISLSTLHHTAEEHHTEIQQQQYQCPQYILQQIIITQRDSKQQYYYQSIHTTSHCRRTSHKETAMAVSLSVHPQYIALQKNITQRDGNGCITICLLYQSIHRTLSAKYNAYSYKLFQKF